MIALDMPQPVKSISELPKLKHVVMNAMLQAYTGPSGPDVQIWGVNRTFQHQHNMTRTFNLHEVGAGGSDWIDKVNALNIPVYMFKHYDEVPMSEPYPLRAILEYFPTLTLRADGAESYQALDYFSCSMAYMLALAIAQDAQTITLSGMYWAQDSEEYMIAKDCLNFWIGLAIGRGIEVVMDEQCFLARPYPWQPRRYGYVKQMSEAIGNSAISEVYKMCNALPRSWVDMTGSGKEIGMESEEKVVEDNPIFVKDTKSA